MVKLARVSAGDQVVTLGGTHARATATAAARAGAKARWAEGDPLAADLWGATVVMLDLPAEVALRLRTSLVMLAPGSRVVSLDADLGDWKPDRSVYVDVPGPKGAPARKASAYLWTVPANLNGDWCGQDAAKGAVLRIGQRLQFVEGAFLKATKALRFEGSIDGTRITAAAGRLALAQSGDILRVTSAQGNYAAYRNTSFARTCCGTCP